MEDNHLQALEQQTEGILQRTNFELKDLGILELDLCFGVDF